MALTALFGSGLLFLSACEATSEPRLENWSEPVFAGIPDAVHLNELSGLTRSNIHPGIFWAINDSGNAAEMYAIDARAKTVAVVTLDGVVNTDWEDISNYRLEGKNYIAIADTGDNGGIRGELAIHIFEEPAQLVSGQHLKPLRSLRFVWPDGPRDAEALMTDTETRQFLMVSKKRVPAELYALPFDAADGSSPKVIGRFDGISQPDATTMNSKGDYGRYRAQITGADLSPDNKTIALLNYQQINFFDLPNAKHPNVTPRQTLTLPWLPQAESIAYSEDGNSLFIGSEQSPSPIIRFDKANP